MFAKSRVVIAISTSLILSCSSILTPVSAAYAAVLDTADAASVPTAAVPETEPADSSDDAGAGDVESGADNPKPALPSADDDSADEAGDGSSANPEQNTPSTEVGNDDTSADDGTDGDGANDAEQILNGGGQAQESPSDQASDVDKGVTEGAGTASTQNNLGKQDSDSASDDAAGEDAAKEKTGETDETADQDEGQTDSSEDQADTEEDEASIMALSDDGVEALAEPAAEQHVTYSVHLAGKGWSNEAKDGALAGNAGQDVTATALKVTLESPAEVGGVSLSVRTSNGGWTNPVASGETAGSTDGSNSIEEIKLSLTGAVASTHDIYYRVYVKEIGWVSWAKNGESAGTSGYGYPVEAVQVRVQSKGSKAPSAETVGSQAMFRLYNPYTGEHFYTASSSERSSLVGVGWTAEGIGWYAPSKSEEPVFRLYNPYAPGGDHHYTTSVQERDALKSVGWRDEGIGWFSDTAKTVAILRQYNPYAQTGTHNYTSDKHENDVLVSKGWRAEGVGWYGTQAGVSTSSGSHIVAPSISVSTFSGGTWREAGSGAVAGTTGQSLPMYALKASLGSSMPQGISYQVHVADEGWRPAAADGAQASSSNADKPIQAVKFSLTGAAEQTYDVWYRVHVDSLGWLGWTLNGQLAGTVNCGLSVQAVQVVVTLKGAAAPGSSANASYQGKDSLPYVGYQTPGNLYKVSHRSVSIKNQGSGTFGYRTESRIPFNATRDQCVNAMIGRAMEYLGTRYVWDYSCAPGVGVDCAGFVMQALYATGMDLWPMNPWDHYYTPGHDQYANFMRGSDRFMHVSFNQRQRGDLILTRGHVSIYLGNDQIIEAWPGTGVRIRSVYATQPVLAVARPFP